MVSPAVTADLRKILKSLSGGKAGDLLLFHGSGEQEVKLEVADHPSSQTGSVCVQIGITAAQKTRKKRRCVSDVLIGP